MLDFSKYNTTKLRNKLLAPGSNLKCNNVWNKNGKLMWLKSIGRVVIRMPVKVDIYHGQNASMYLHWQRLYSREFIVSSPKTPSKHCRLANIMKSWIYWVGYNTKSIFQNIFRMWNNNIHCHFLHHIHKLYYNILDLVIYRLILRPILVIVI